MVQADHEELKAALMERDPLGGAAHRPPAQAELAYLAAKVTLEDLKA